MNPPCVRFVRSRNSLRAMVIAVGTLVAAAACSDKANRPPRAEFIVAAGDSTYWVKSEPAGIKLRGSPMVLARLDGRFIELYVVDDDRSFENAMFIGQRLFERDLASGDSSEIFRDTVVPSIADAYQRSHPEARRLGPDEDAGEEPASSATVEISVLGVHGPFLSVESHVDTSGANDEAWHMTRQSVVDLRTGKQASLADVLGPSEASTVSARARKLYQETVDSIRRDRRPVAQRAARSMSHFRFDPSSFSLAAPNGTLMIAFSAPGQGSGGEGFMLPMRPIPITEPPWWAEARGMLPSRTREREEYWARGTYNVKAHYDTTARPVALTLIDSAGREFRVGSVSAPVHRIYWLDRPAIDRAQRAALSRAFDESALYDDDARASVDLRGREQTNSVRLAMRR